MQIFRPLCALVVASLVICHITGCSLIVETAKMGNQDKAAFHWVNMERQKAGLRPLSREEWKLQMNTNEVRRSRGDFAGIQTKSRAVQGEKKPAYSPAPTIPQE